MTNLGRVLNPVHLSALEMVIRTGSFADAGRRLGYTGSAVSQQISALERDVKMTLFVREAHSVRATPAGVFVAERSRDALAALSLLDDDIRAMAHGTVGRLRIGSFPTGSERLLPWTLAAYAKTHSGVEVQLDEGEPDDLVALLEVAELDVALVYTYDMVPRSWPKAVTADHLIDDPLVLLLPADHRYAGAPSVALADLRDDVWISTRHGTAGASALPRICARAGFPPQVAYRSNDYDVVAKFVESGLGIALVPTLALLSAVDVVTAQLQDMPVCRHICVLYRSPTANPAVPALIERVHRAAAVVSDQMREFRLRTS